MAFEQKTWIARQGAGLNKYTDVNTGQVFNLMNTPDNVIVQGDAFTAANMNDLEERIASGFTDIGEIVEPMAMDGWTLQQGETVLGNVTGYYVQSGSFLFAWGSGGGMLQKINASVVINLPETLGNVTWATGQVSTAATTIQADSYIITAPASGMSVGNKVWITPSIASPGGQFTPNNWLNVTAFWFAAVTDAGAPEPLLLSAESASGGYTAGDNIEINSNGVISVLTTDEATQDGTRPITSGGVYNIVGNIEALLETI